MFLLLSKKADKSVRKNQNKTIEKKYKGLFYDIYYGIFKHIFIVSKYLSIIIPIIGFNILYKNYYRRNYILIHYIRYIIFFNNIYYFIF